MRNPYSFLHLTSLTCAVVVGTLALPSEAQAHADHSDASNGTVPNPKNLSYDDYDNDAYAIPLDNSRTELDEEEEELEQMEQDNIQRQQRR